MNAHKSFHSLSEKCTRLIHRFGNSSRTYCFMKREKYKLSSQRIPRTAIQNPVVFPQLFLVYRYSQTPSAEPMPASSGGSNYQPVKFEDVSFEEPVKHEDLIKALQKCESISEQMKTLASTVALSTDDIQKRADFCKTIEKLLEPFFNDFRIQMFGSTVNHFGFKGCDIDMTFGSTTEEKRQSSYLETPDVPLISEVLSGKVTPQELSELPPKEQLIFIHTVFLEYYKESAEPPIFINAHVPLVRFHHDKFKLKCDLTFKNRVAYANTKWLCLLAKLDDRVIPLMMTLRYWAKHVELIGKGLMFNTYTVTLLVVHFLQTRNPPILPSAEYVMSFSNSLEIEDMNDKSFLDIKNKIPQSKNTESLEELLREFFFYYLYFDFTRVICPLIGSSVPREEFFADPKNNKFRMHSICVQDPMCLSHNVAELVDYKLCKKLFSELMVACQTFQGNQSFPHSEAWGLLTIFDNSKETSRFGMQKLISLSIPVLSRDTNGKSIPEQERVKTSCEIILDILKHALLFQCTSLNKNKVEDMLKHQDNLVAKQKQTLESLVNVESKMAHLQKSKKLKSSSGSTNDKPEESMLEQFQKCNDEHELIFSAECKVTKNIWLGREFANLGSSSNSSKNILDREYLVSKAAADRNMQHTTDKIKPFLFLFECYVSKDNSKSSLLINFRPLQRMSFNPILGIFLKEYIPKIVSEINVGA